jgi:hypothetical protein
MIDSHATRERSARQLWSGHVQRILQQLNLHDRKASGEISESLAVFCQQHPHVSRRALSLLMARSFCATGDVDAAGRILNHDRTHRPHVDSWLQILSADHPFPELYPLFSSRALRPLRLHSVSHDAVWVLDLQKIHLTEADQHELILLQTLRVLTETASNVWKKTDGQGTLVVKGLVRFSDPGRTGNKQSILQPAKYIQQLLQHHAARNGWSAVPAVLLLDL